MSINIDVIEIRKALLFETAFNLATIRAARNDATGMDDSKESCDVEDFIVSSGLEKEYDKYIASYIQSSCDFGYKQIMEIINGEAERLKI